MPLIHNKNINFILRNTLRPFRKVLPTSAYFAINGLVSIKLPENKVIKFNCNPTSNLVRVLFWYGVEGFEYSSLKPFIHLTKNSNNFFDIGANLGYYSIVAKLYNKDILVTAFEPLQGIKKNLISTAKLNGITNIDVEDYAVTDFNGTAEFAVTFNEKFSDIEEQLIGDGSLNLEVNKKANIARHKVKTIMLDDYVKQTGKVVDLIKLDTEANEHKVLAGAKNVLQNHRPIIMCEVIKNQIEKELFEALKPYDYLIYNITPNGLVQKETIGVEELKEDFFFVPREKKNLILDFILEK